MVPNEDATIGTLVGGGVTAVAAGIIGAPLLVAGAAGVAGIVGASWLARKMGYNTWLSDKKEERVVARPLCCIACKSPVKHLR